MFTLYGAFPFAQMHDISIIVGYNLKFDVLRVFEVFFDKYRRIVKGYLCFCGCYFVKLFEFILMMDNTHSSSSSARYCFDNDRIA